MTADLSRLDVPLSVDADYAGWAEWVAAREVDNRRAREATS